MKSALLSSQTKECCFLVKKSADSTFESHLSILWQPKVNLEWMRTKLWTEYKVPKDRRIFYIDDDGDSVPIDLECELQEALKLACKCVVNPILLIVGSFEETSGKHFWFDEAFLSEKKQSRNIKSTSIVDTWYPYDSWYTGNRKFLEFSNTEKIFEQATIIMKSVLELEKSLNAKRDKPNKTKIPQTDEQVESKVDIQEELNASLQQSLNCTLPPLWFTEYMESMKKDMMSTITSEVVKNVTEALNKRLDSLALSLIKDFDSSLATRHPQCTSDSNEKNQQKISSQDKEQLSDVSITRTDEPRNAKDMQIKKDVISTITNEVVKEVTEMLNKIPSDLLIPVPSKDQSRSQSHLPSSTLSRYSFDSHSSETKLKKSRFVPFGVSSDDDSILKADVVFRPCFCENSTRQLKNRLDLEDAFCTSTEEEEKKIRAEDMEKEKKQFVQTDIVWKDFVSSNQQSRTERESNEVVQLETSKPIENELRMSCSVTGNQMLDEGRLSKDTLHNLYLISDTSDNTTSFWSCDQEEKGEKKKEEDDDAFEIIQMPASTDELFMEPFVELAIEQQNNSSRDSPSFELLSEPASPPSSIRLDEDHFSADEEKLEQQSRKTNSSNSVSVEDIFNKMCETLKSVNVDERISVYSRKQPDVTLSFVMTDDEDIPSMKEACSSKSSCMQHRSNERKGPRDDGSYDDVRNSHASYLTVQNHCDSKTQSQCSCQSQTDSSDFTQSFHSHTTSVTDTTDMYAHTYASKYGEQTMANDVREPPIIPSAAILWNNHDVRVDGSWTKEPRTNVYRQDKCPNDPNYPEHSCASNNNYRCSWDPSFGASYQPYEAASRVTRSSDRSCSNVGSRKTSAGELNTADSVHILPETLVSAAAQVGSFAFDAAREMFDKLRAHTKEDPLKRSRGGVKCENKKPINHLPFY